jgi:hypothetical protein
MFQTDLILNYIDGSQMVFANVSPDNRYKVLDGFLTFEDDGSEKIHYIPIEIVRNFYTVCVEVHD